MDTERKAASDMGVVALGYLVLRGPIEKWRTFGTGVLGLQEGDTPADGGDQLWFRMDQRSHRVVIEEGAPGLVALGFETASSDDLDQVGRRLEDAGVKVEENPALAGRRHVRRVLTCDDPNGHHLEVFCGAEQSTAEFASPRGVRFVTEGMGLGHVVMPVADRNAVVGLYTSALGFRLTDTIGFGRHEAAFMHCNPRHHTVAFFGNVDLPPGIQHFMVEMDSLEGVGRALDHARQSGAEIVANLGMHSNDRMVSFYCKTPSGNDVEVGWNGLLVDDDDWLIRHYTSATLWGHERVDFSFSQGV